MTTLNEVKGLVLALHRMDRCALAEWLSEEIGEKWHVEEPRFSYGAAAEVLSPLTLEEFLQFESGSAVYHEYVAGEIYAMTEVSQPHALIESNLMGEIAGHLKGKPCRVYSGKRSVQFKAHGHDIVYRPDLWVACGHERDSKGEFIDPPKLVVEVLSPSTERTDRREKALYYRELPTLEEIALVSQQAVRITLLRRSQGWIPVFLSERNERVEFESIGLSVRMARLFEGLP